MKQEDLTEKATVLDLFEKGKAFTEDLLRENENLRMIIARLKTEIRDIESRLTKALSFFQPAIVRIPHLQHRI